MAEIRPFRGLHYNPAHSDRMEALIAPPYDVIPPEREPIYRGRDPHNIIELELPEPGPESNRYRHAASVLRRWLDDGVLAYQEQPALYLYGETFALPGAEERTRYGVFTLLRLEEFETGIVLPHEQTFPKHKEDRFQLLSACEAQISPIFGLYDAPGGVVSRWSRELGARPPAADATDDEGVRHRMWEVTDAGEIAAWRGEMAALSVLLADGHHRYETALRYRAERRAAEPGGGPAWYDYVMILLVEMSDPGLQLFPTHRLVRFERPPDWEAARTCLRQWFDHRELPVPAPAEVVPLLAGAPGAPTLGMLVPPGDRLELWTLRDSDAVARISPRERSEAWRRLDVVALHALVFGEGLGGARSPEAFSVSYTREAAEAIQSVRSCADTQTGAFFLRPPTMQEVRAVAMAGDRMPEKTTYFWPKAVTGLVILASGGFVADL
jgi:uncharacterized protein (DUF1015 family)